MEKDVIILTCSAKHRGYCVAGIDLTIGEWIRLVGSEDLDTNEIPKRFMYYSDSTICKPLDVVSVNVIENLPGDIQSENVLVDLNKKPVYKDFVRPEQLKDYISYDRYIYGGISPYIDRITAVGFGYSLALYKVLWTLLRYFSLE